MSDRPDLDYAGGFDDDSVADIDGPPDASTLGLDQVSKMLRLLRHLYRELGEYEALHQAELSRIAAAHERYAAPVVRRIERIEEVLRQYAARAWVDFRKARTITPNGAITASRALLPELTVRDDVLAEWTWVGPIVELRPKVPVAKLRDLLGQLERQDTVRRAVLRDETLVVIEQGEVFERELRDGERGVYVERLGDDDPWLLIEGLQWTPAGHYGSGRTFTVAPA